MPHNQRLVPLERLSSQRFLLSPAIAMIFPNFSTFWKTIVVHNFKSDDDHNDVESILLMMRVVMITLGESIPPTTLNPRPLLPEPLSENI